MSASAEEPLNVGEDSFMDTIANLVGVLIILVAVVGMRAEQMVAPRIQNPQREQVRKQLENTVLETTQVANTLEMDSSRLEQDLFAEQRLVARLNDERRQKLIWIELAKRQLAEKLAELDTQSRQRLEWIADQARLQQELAQLQMQRRAAATQPRTVDLVHYPTPIAKTVFADELHFRLEQGRLVYVPIEELIAAMKAEWKHQAEKMGDQPALIEAIGPIENFRMEYELIAERGDPLQLESSAALLIKFNRFVILPMSDELGEPLADALRDGSQFRERLRRQNPARTTVSLWVYPDSYEPLSELKGWLREQGFQAACWPMEAGQPISGGPRGLRTTAQ